jgi:hypothetical protein
MGGYPPGVQTPVAGSEVEGRDTVVGGPSRRRVGVAFAVFGGGAVIGLGLLALFAFLFVRLSWPHVEPLGHPEFGINYSCNHAEYLLLEDPALGPAGYVPDSRPGRAEWCAQTLGTLLTGTGAKHVRISVEWSQAEPQEGVYDFRMIDALLAEAEKDGAKVLLTVGVKGQRSPEFYLPDWVLSKTTLGEGEVISDDPLVHDAALAMVRTVVAHVAGSGAIEAWEADNEPYVASNRSDNWTLSQAFVEEEVATIRAGDAMHREITINHAQHLVFDRRWQEALADADVLSASIYPYRNYEILGHQYVVPILELGWLAQNYAAQARAAHEEGKPFWLTEMQAEPWADIDLRLISPEHPSPNLTVANFEQSLDYARRSGADRVYLWGAEWWLYEKVHFGDSTWWDLGRAAIGGR